MIRDEHLAIFLKSVVAELENSVRPQLTSGTALGSVAAINVTLGRLIAEVESGGRIAGNYQPRWSALLTELPVAISTGGGAPVAVAAPGRPLQQLDQTLHAIQQRMEGSSFESFVAALARGDAGATTWMANSANTFHHMMQDIEDSFFRPASKALAAEAVTDPEAIRRNLGAYLARRFPELGADCVMALRIVPGGQAKRTVLFELVANDHLPTRLVMRQDMAHSITGTTVTDEFGIVKRVFDLGLPVPEPLLLEADAAIMGGPFMIVREAIGAVGAGTYFPEERRYLGSTMGPDFGREIAGTLARLHRLTFEQPTLASAGEDDESKTIMALQAEWKAAPNPPNSIAMDLGFAWLRAKPLPPGRPRCLIHGDVGAHNMMTRDGHLAALIDWELAKCGDPAEDLAQAKMMLLDDVMPWDDFVRAYIEQGGPPEACNAHAVGYYSVRTYLKHSVLNYRLWDYFTAGKRSDAAAASVATHWVDRLALYLSRALADAVAADPEKPH